MKVLNLFKMLFGSNEVKSEVVEEIAEKEPIVINCDEPKCSHGDTVVAQSLCICDEFTKFCEDRQIKIVDMFLLSSIGPDTVVNINPNMSGELFGEEYTTHLPRFTVYSIENETFGTLNVYLHTGITTCGISDEYLSEQFSLKKIACLDCNTCLGWFYGGEPFSTPLHEFFDNLIFVALESKRGRRRRNDIRIANNLKRKKKQDIRVEIAKKICNIS